MRLKEFQQYLKQEKIDLTVFIHPDINITYFTQLKPSFALLAITPTTASFYLSGLDDVPKLKGISVKVLKKGWEKKLANPKVKKVGINKDVVSVGFWEKLHKLFPKAKLVDVSGELKQLRAQKTEEEVKKVGYACKVTDDAFNELVNCWKKQKFKTEQDVAHFLEEYFRKHKCTTAFPTIAAMGKNAAIPHYHTSKGKLKRGFLLLDFGASYQNYNADCSRTLFLGTPSKAERELYELLLKAQQSAIAQINAGKTFWELQQSVKRGLGKYSSHFIHLLGHGVGIDVHETPSFSLEAKEKIKNGQVFTIEPGIYFPKKCGLRIEDTVWFDGKVKVLTKSPKELITL
ncbi:aminopeptidase P family protein [Candidatus Woesearchaeota archaeon]|nr:aminopeptidase P family protein [Candidatus Woesearchaeota archaeon]